MMQTSIFFNKTTLNKHPQSIRSRLITHSGGWHCPTVFYQQFLVGIGWIEEY
jgi:hypothetical protein